MRSRPLFMPLFAVVVCVLAWPALGEPIPVTPSESDSSARSIVGSILEEPHSQEEGTARRSRLDRWRRVVPAPALGARENRMDL